MKPLVTVEAFYFPAPGPGSALAPAFQPDRIVVHDRSDYQRQPKAPGLLCLVSPKMLHSVPMCILITADRHYKPAAWTAYLAFTQCAAAQQPDVCLLAGKERRTGGLA